LAEPAVDLGLTADSIVEALSRRPAPLAEVIARKDHGGLPTSPGVYAWWAEPTLIPGMPTMRHPTVTALALYYVGISPSRDGSKQSIRPRVLGQHCRGNISASTFRFALASLLMEELDLVPRLRGRRVVLDSDDNARLRRWQEKHLHVTWSVRDRPWEVESEVIHLMHPPMNSAGNAAHPYFSRMLEARAAFRAAAIDA
jgi:hypothetical protein